jgi:branched-chain amino acid aminotransferase
VSHGPRAGSAFAWIDGRLLAADDARVSVFDRGFQLGDGVFETLRARAGRPIELDAHLARLRRSADGLGITLPPDAAARLADGVGRLLDAEGQAGRTGDASVRITVTRGPIRGRGLLPADEAVAPTIVIQTWPVVPPPPGHVEAGLRLVSSAIRRDPSNPLVALKTTSRADFVFARLEARRAGADDAVFLTLAGDLSEATTANVFVLAGTELATPSAECAILPGTTRSWILAWGVRQGLSVSERRIPVDEVRAADEAFLSSSVAGILPVTGFEGRPVGSGRPGPWTRRARADREAFIRGEGDDAGPGRGR